MLMSHTPTLKPGAVIAPGAGAGLPDRWALKSADRILAAFYDVTTSADERMKILFETRSLRGGGNPAAQRRFVETIKRAHGDALLRCEAVYGKRAKFLMAFDWFEPIPAQNGFDEGDDMSWLGIGRTILEKTGAGKRSSVSDGLICAWSKHSLVRLIQRAGVTDAIDLRELLIDVWPRVSTAEYHLREAREAKPRSVWMVPFRAHHGELLVAVMSPSRGGDLTFPVIKTVMPVEYLKDDLRAHVEQLDQVLADHVDGRPAVITKDDDMKIVKLRAALKACQKDTEPM